MAPQAQGQQGRPSAPGSHPKKPSNTKSTSGPRSVVPAIPLPLIPKQSNPGHYKRASKNGDNGTAASSLEAALIDHTTTTDNSGFESTYEAGEATTKTAETQPTTSTPDKRYRSAVATGNSAAPSFVNETGEGNYTNGVAGPHSGTGNSVNASHNSSGSPVVTAGPNDAMMIEGSRNGDPASMAHRPQPPTAPGRADLVYPPGLQPMPPHSGHPLQPPISNGRHLDNPGMNAPPHMPHLHHPQHHHQMSNGNIMFGGFPESHTPSPATAGGFMPPGTVNGEGRNLARTNGHHPSHSTNNGFPAPINTQLRPGMPPVSGMDSYGHGPASGHQTPFDNYPSGTARFGPPTPHSFHGSHGSGEPNGLENGALPFPPPNSVHFPGHPPHEHPSGHFPPFPPPQAFGRHPGMMMDNLMESVSYLKNQFDNGELADCVLELVHSEGRHHPVKITGHKLMFGQSPALKQHIMAARTQEVGSHIITIETNDHYLRNDAWWSAVQHLYLHPLLTLPPIAANGAGSIDFAGDKNDRFEFCLGYAAAGHLLSLSDVLIRGLQVASALVDWNTIEDALAFVFDRAVQRHIDYGIEQDGADTALADVEFVYGRETKILLDSVVNFLINAFPPDFELDPTVSDPPRFARIPVLPADTSVVSPTNGATPTIARGSTTRSTTKPGRLGNIKFGDLPPALPGNGPAQQLPAACSSVLSRVLLNLPFDELRAVMASESHGSSAWNTSQARYHAVVDVVDAREARRLRAVEVVRAGLVPHSYQIKQRLSSHRRHAVAEPWDILNWQEEVILPRRAEVPRIVRKWVPQFSDVEPEYPVQQPIYDGPGSMV